MPTEHKLQIGHWFVERLRNKELTCGSELIEQEKKTMLGTHHQIKKTNWIIHVNLLKESDGYERPESPQTLPQMELNVRLPEARLNL